MNKSQVQVVSEMIGEQMTLGRDVRARVAIGSVFDHDGKRYGLRVSVHHCDLIREAELSALADAPTVYLTLDELKIAREMMADLILSHEETLRQLEAGVPYKEGFVSGIPLRCHTCGAERQRVAA